MHNPFNPTLIFTLFSFLFTISTQVHGQYLSAGPVVSGVSDSTANIYVRTFQPATVELQIDTDSMFSNPTVLTEQTDSANYFVKIFKVDNLTDSTRYYYRFLVNDSLDQRTGQFLSFPQPDQKGYYKIAVGSCNYSENVPLFTLIKEFDPHLFIHLGDWNWPPAGFGWDYNLFPDRQAESFASRFNDTNMRSLIQPFMPIDYTYDDDYSHNDSEGWTFPTFQIMTDSNGVTTTRLYTDSLPGGIRTGVIHAYQHYFPSYELADSTQGIFHSYQLGNIDLFLTDNRLSRSARHAAFQLDTVSGFYSFNPPPDHTMLGDVQRNWLLDGLQQSTSDWKIITSGVTFNPKLKNSFDLAINPFFQPISFDYNGAPQTGVSLASNLSYNWFAYENDQQPLLDLQKNGTVKDMVMLTGDTHSCAIDDGTNSGIPEMNASGLAANNEGTLYYLIDSINAVLSLPSVVDSMWNGGGNGVGNANFSDAFGTLEFFGDDSLRMCVIDEMGQTMAV